ncbi:voltage-dependent ion-selective channel protein [Ceratobasidium sp. AG-Ba]|nr:voltage-dependent ion-selective channel protein [Ceratobasidium sp. AG-Ba]
MAAYYSGPRVRLPSNRSLQLTEYSSSSSSPLASPPSAPAPVLIFPAPSSEPASPHPSSFHSRARTSSSLAYGPLRLRHVRVDSNASSSPSLLVNSDLSSPLSGSSPRLGRSPLTEWEDLELLSGPSTSTGASPLTRERIVRLGSARLIPSSWRSGTGSGETPSVEMWEWTSTESGGEVERWPEEETNYEDALSQFHFPTLEESRFAAAPPARSHFDRMRVGAHGGGTGATDRRGAVLSLDCVRPTHPSMGEHTTSAMRLPFRFVLETVLGISPATLMLLERGAHAPETIEQTGLFGAASSGMSDEVEEHEGSEDEEVRPRVCLNLDAAVTRSVRDGLGALSLEGLSLPLELGASVYLSIYHAVWAGVPAIPKLWRR